MRTGLYVAIVSVMLMLAMTAAASSSAPAEAAAVLLPAGAAAATPLASATERAAGASSALTVTPMQTRRVDALASLSVARAGSRLRFRSMPPAAEDLPPDPPAGSPGLVALTARSLDALAMAELVSMALRRLPGRAPGAESLVSVAR